jgi:hypothetical protein
MIARRNEKMGYRKVKPYLEYFDNLNCGLFNSETDLNNGYGCRSESKYKDEPGKCYQWDCPLCYSADLSDLKKFDKQEYEDWLKYILDKGYTEAQYSNTEESQGSLDDFGCELVVVYREVAA